MKIYFRLETFDTSNCLINLHILRIKSNSVALVRKQTIPTERPPQIGEVSAKFADRGCRVVSATDTQSR
jgi:hypothetical protein